ncbi:Hypothetical protein R9X50_00389600 [Acrodontium crateriforme]|uniref:Aminoglycoside phosphotransferase domain-containing protein n=1 Tax=Acrodontium crateriforme TaxID=150365 RepID=A0AAQ3M713_9PEZI|nr:Hypothetical protein R9X50_00389600 [Acrodontium crateriforme]
MAESCAKHPRIDISRLPDISQAEMDFLDTSFFQHDFSRQLPSPESILHQFPKLRAGKKQPMRAIKDAFPQNKVPVPELFGWRRYRDRNFIYMSLIEGKTLHVAWPILTETEKRSISARLSRIIVDLHQITCTIFSDALIRSINGGAVQDRFFEFNYEGGPFASIQSYNNWLVAAGTRQTPQLEGYMDGPFREFFPDKGNVYFTHGDLTLTTIMVSEISGCMSVTAVIDWEQAGWYPEYWEYCKLLCGVDYEHEWREARWANQLMNPFEDEWTAFSEYLLWRCP